MITDPRLIGKRNLETVRELKRKYPSATIKDIHKLTGLSIHTVSRHNATVNREWRETLKKKLEAPEQKEAK